MRTIKTIKKGKRKTTRPRNLDELKEENEMLKLQLTAREKELEEYRKKLDELHKSISYKVGRWVAETKVGGWLKKILRKYIWK